MVMLPLPQLGSVPGVPIVVLVAALPMVRVAGLGSLLALKESAPP
ncbi:MAG: hypothetical protein U0841_27335 [Chloroflexia bacterium]